MSEAKKLKEEFCVFFDVLGTKSKFLTSNFEEEEKLVKKYENFIKDIKEILINNGFKENEIKLFSDSIFINFPNTTLKEIYDIFRCLAYIQIMAIEKYNFLLRGGVEYSTICNEKDIVIGKGLVVAVELEKEANYPIIMLGERAKEELSKKDDFINKQYINDFIKNEPEIENIDSAIAKIKIMREKNGESIATIIRINDKTYINYLATYYENQNRESFIKMMLRHKKFIIESLKKNEEEFLKDTKNSNNNELKNYFDYTYYNINKNYILEYIKEIDEQNKKILHTGSPIKQKNIEFKEKLENNYKEKKELKKELVEVDKKIKQINFCVKGNSKENILKVREKYIYLLYYHNSFLRRVFEKDKGIDKNNYDECFLNVEKEIL
ncbi:hypothetical protein ACW0S1_11200 [Fusobacterium polymorphum]|jgi:hypothetical protein|uniref:Guanylate cyclase domain-containing protein n=1 Tax=Fusobacterium nucleatum subsp. polymorphum TaxID=76857 RepID=A0A0S2ZRR3_FUSNP|nr:hypothetical protein [Fusobacterium polymorphum]ALM94462.1 hypothetical protein RO02_07465 [Fusobacterium polymorphum]ALQ41595.1 hypothetical protein RN93_01960 [Fusobacterium polymorphum]ASG29413.1 hypothetical protein CBG61_11360 [Fusobacterium polymorphum]